MRLFVVLCGVAFAAVISSPARSAEPDEAVVGKWVSTEPAGQPMEFLKDGKFKFGWTKQKGGWKMADGTYKIDKDGKIKAGAMSGGVGLTLDFKFEKDTITGTIGAKNYTFKKQEEKKEPKKDP